MSSGIPKQFLLLAGKPILIHTLEVFHTFSPASPVFLVLPENHFKHWQHLCKEYHCTIPHQLIQGGVNRFESVKNGLSHINPPGMIAIHDGVRPFLSRNLLTRVLETASDKGNAIPVCPVNESLRKVEGSNNCPVPRENYVTVQTPQAFSIAAIKEAYQQAYLPSFTDDATVLESTGKRISLVEGEASNIKITTAADLLVAEGILKRRAGLEI